MSSRFILIRNINGDEIAVNTDHIITAYSSPDGDHNTMLLMNDPYHELSEGEWTITLEHGISIRDFVARANAK